ncbi:MAG: (d)CMP kinase [Bacteroidota bacterium]
MLIAIDGPAGSGKSSTARAVAERLGGLYLDTGAMYRAVTLHFLQTGTPATEEAAPEALDSLDVSFERKGSGYGVTLGGEDVSEAIRSDEVTANASAVAALAPVRKGMTDEQRKIGRHAAEAGVDVVVDGRDIGTVVFPDAGLKVFMVATPEERARRRLAEYEAAGRDTSFESVLADIKARDEKDASRALAPLKPADDAIHLDTTGLSFDAQVEKILAWIEMRRGA